MEEPTIIPELPSGEHSEPVIDAETPVVKPVRKFIPPYLRPKPIPPPPKKKRVYKKLTRIDKAIFAKNTIKHHGNATVAYKETFPQNSARYASAAGPLLFKDPEVQEIFNSIGIDIPFLAHHSRELMETGEENTRKDLVKHFTKPLLRGDNVQRVEKVTVSLFGELTDGSLQLIRQGKKLKYDGRTRLGKEAKAESAASDDTPGSS